MSLRERKTVEIAYVSDGNECYENVNMDKEVIRDERTFAKIT